MAKKILKDDQVIVIAGKDKGKKGTVLRVYPADNKLLIEGVNVAKKHVKGNPNKGVSGGIVEREMPIHVSNVALVDSAGMPSRVSFAVLEDGRKVRRLKSNDEIID